MQIKPFAIAATVAALLALPAHAADYIQAPGSSLAFAGSYQGDTFSGTFPDFRTRLRFDPDDLASGTLEVTIPLASASTGNPDYDGEMRGEAFLDATRFAQARYTAQGFRSLGGNRYASDGTLELHGVRKPVTLEFTWTPGPRPLLRGQASVSRLAFGVGAGDWADTGLIPDLIAISTRVYLQPAE